MIHWKLRTSVKYRSMYSVEIIIIIAGLFESDVLVYSISQN